MDQALLDDLFAVINTHKGLALTIDSSHQDVINAYLDNLERFYRVSSQLLGIAQAMSSEQNTGM